MEQIEGKTVRINAPEEYFEKGAYIMRRKRIAAYTVDRIKTLGQENKIEEMFDLLAQAIPTWSGMTDADTEEPLKNPCDDAMVFYRLDALQINWVMDSLRINYATGKFFGAK